MYDAQRVRTIAALDLETLIAVFATGASGNRMAFLRHTCGRQITEVARRALRYGGCVGNIAWHEDVMVTTSIDMTVCVWSLSARKALKTLRGDRGIACAAVSSRYIALGCHGKSILRLHGNDGAEFPLISVLDGLHGTHPIKTLQFIDPDLIFSVSRHHTACFSVLSPDTRPIARQNSMYIDFRDAAILADGQIALVGSHGVASMWALPLAVVDTAKERALPKFGSVAGSAAVLRHEPLPPPQDALVDANAGRLTAGEDGLDGVVVEEVGCVKKDATDDAGIVEGVGVGSMPLKKRRYPTQRAPAPPSLHAAAAAKDRV